MPGPQQPSQHLSDRRPDGATLTAFFAGAVIAGANAVAVRIGLEELAPFWGAAVRFLIASAVLIVAALLLRLSFPRGRALLGASLFGLLNFGVVYLCLYWALQEVTAGTVMVAFAVAPLFTHLLAAVQKVEQLTYRGLIGAAVAGVGLAYVFSDTFGSVTPLSMVAILIAALAAAQSPIVVKTFPAVQPVVMNGGAMAVGGAVLLVASALRGEPWVMPTTPDVQVSLVYLVFIGSIGLFLLFLFVVRRWTASASIYVLLLAPLAAVGVEYVLLGETPTPRLLIGGLVAITGVYVGTLLRLRPRPG